MPDYRPEVYASQFRAHHPHPEDARPNSLHGDFRPTFEPEDAKGLLRPVVVVPDQVRDEAARLAESLGIGETVVGSPQFGLRLLSVLDVERGRIPPIDSSLLIE